MPAANDDERQAAYRPTSLDFINLPNPIEPHAGSQRHPLNGTSHLAKARLKSSTNQDLLKLILETDVEQRAKRQKTTDNPHLDLPKLPVRSGPKRPRIPPTLSGLHQPPPDAGLLPSISVDQPRTPPPRTLKVAQPQLVPAAPEFARPAPASAKARENAPAAREQPAKQQKKRTTRNKWSEVETSYLLKGVARFGIGNWTKILNCPDYTFANRTALDLKDRFRVCCPEQYRKPGSGASATSEDQNDASGKENLPDADQKLSKGPPPERVSSSKLRELGIDQPFVKAGRRSRHGYSAAEDEALLKGFRKHGNKWSLIRQDAELDLSQRKPTDLRDRFRTRFPEEFAQSGSTSKGDKASAIPKRVTEDTSDTAASSEGEVSTALSSQAGVKSVPASAAPAMPPIINEDSSSTKPSSSKRLFPHFSLDDVFLGASFGEEDDGAENGRITLDRGILDWPGGDSSKIAAEPAKNSGIDPLVTLKLPKPHASLQTPVPATQQPASTNNQTSLPSLSAIFPDASSSEQLELPSLMTLLGSMEGEGRNGGNTFPSIEDLFGQ